MGACQSIFSTVGRSQFVGALKLRLFSLPLTRTAFLWFSSLSTNSISSWKQLERKFHDQFYSPDNEIKLLDLISVKQGRDESVNDYIRRFRDTKNRCFNLIIGERISLIWVLTICIPALEKSQIVMLLLLLLSCNKTLRPKKIELKNLRIIFDQFVAMYSMLIMIPIALVMSLMVFCLAI